MFIIHCIVEVGGKHVGTKGAQVEAVTCIVCRAFPEQVKIVDVAKVVSGRSSMKPGVEMKNSAVATSTAAKCREWTRNENRFT